MGVGGEIEGSATQIAGNPRITRGGRIGSDQRNQLVEETLHLEGIADGRDFAQEGVSDSKCAKPAVQGYAVDRLVGKLE